MIKNMNKSILFSILLSMIVIVMLFVGIMNTQDEMNEKDLDRLEESIKRAAINCYGIEGFYPSNVTYLQEHYGIVIDSKKYHVFYESIGSNLMPEIQVFRKE